MLTVRVIGPIRVELDGATIETPAHRREWLLLAWLALHPGRHRRGELAARFWPDVLDSSARASLRSALWALRRALGEAGEPHLRTSRDEIGLEEGDGLWVDALRFDQLVDGGGFEEAVALGEGELLAGFDEPWVVDARIAYRERMTGALEQLAQAADRAGERAQAVTLTRRQVALDPLDEEPHRRLMRRLGAAGDHAAALADYARLRERLRRELAVVPSLTTRRLAEQLQLDATLPAPGMRSIDQAAAPSTLVGRGLELDQLLEAWRAVQAGHGGAVLITGEGGIGKTRLATELVLRATAEGARGAQCAGLDLAWAPPMGLWAELVVELGSELEAPPLQASWPSDLATLVPDLERLFDRDHVAHPVTAPEFERARLYEAIVELVGWAARSRPLVLLMDDVHLADAASLQLAGYLARRLLRLPVLLVMTSRPHPRRAELDALRQLLRAGGVLRAHVQLGPLGAQALEQLVRDAADLGGDAVADAVRSADGNALLALERARALARGEREPPASLRAAVAASLGPLDGQAQLLADFAAIAGRELQRPELEALELENPTAAATAVLDSGLFVAARGRVGFRHALLRDAAYAELPDPRRAWLHETLAEVLRRDATPAQAAEIARHLRLAGRDDRAIDYLARAAAHARAVGALDQAAAFLTEAIELTGDDPALLIELAEIEAWRSRGDACDAAFHRAIRKLPRSGEEPARAWLRRVEWNRGALCRPREILRAAARAIEALDDAGIAAPETRAGALAMWAWAEAVAGDAEQAQRLLEEVHSAIGREGGDSMLVHNVGHARAQALVRQGRFAESYAPQIAAGEAAQRLGRPDLACSCWLNAACTSACAGELERALEFVERGREAISGEHFGWFDVQMLAACAHVLARLGRVAEARAAADQERAVAERLDAPQLIATAAHDRGMVAVATGEDELAADLLAFALEHDALVSRPLAHLARAEALVRLGRGDEAEAALRATTLEPLRPGDFPETLVPKLTRIQGLIAAARGDRELAARRLEEAAAGWRALLDRAGDGERYTSAFADFARPPVLGLVEPERELALVEADLYKLMAPSF
jgi:DNA-binding SARP family transcriptional activator/tetratricopeptide (TPR) repeat protein